MGGSQTHQIRQLITTAFARHGVSGPITETHLLSNGHYFGRKYACGSLQAIWVPDKGLIEILGEHCRLVEAINVEKADEQPAKAA